MKLMTVRRFVLALMVVGSIMTAALTQAMAQPFTPAPMSKTAFIYQGQLQTNGAPATGSYDFKLTLHDAAIGEAQVDGTGTMTQNAVAIANGQFEMPLDFGEAWDSNARFLEIAVRPAGTNVEYTTLATRQEIASAPYDQYSIPAASANDPGSVATLEQNPSNSIAAAPSPATINTITIPGSALSHASSANITNSEWGLSLASAAPPVGFVLPQPRDWDKTTPFTLTLYFALSNAPVASTVNWRLKAGGSIVNSSPANANTGWDSLDYSANEDATPLSFTAAGSRTNLMKKQSWTAKYSSTFNTWYFGNPGVGVTTANDFSDNPIWHFAFQRGATIANGESYTGNLIVVAAELTYHRNWVTIGNQIWVPQVQR